MIQMNLFSVKPDSVQLETSAADNKACRGDIISINCSAEAVPSEISYQLLENGSVVLDKSGAGHYQVEECSSTNVWPITL